MRRNECGNCIDQGEWRWWQCGVWTPHCGVGHQECGHQDGSFVRPVASGGSCRNIHRTIQSLCRIWQDQPFKTAELFSASQPFGLENAILITAIKHLRNISDVFRQMPGHVSFAIPHSRGCFWTRFGFDLKSGGDHQDLNIATGHTNDQRWWSIEQQQMLFWIFDCIKQISRFPNLDEISFELYQVWGLPPINRDSLGNFVYFFK